MGLIVSKHMLNPAKVVAFKLEFCIIRCMIIVGLSSVSNLFFLEVSMFISTYSEVYFSRKLSFRVHTVLSSCFARCFAWFFTLYLAWHVIVTHNRPCKFRCHEKATRKFSLQNKDVDTFTCIYRLIYRFLGH